MTDELKRAIVQDLEFKFSSEGEEEGTFTGYGAVFGNVDSHGDVIVKGAFKETLADARKGGRWPAMLLQHGGWGSADMTPIGVWTELDEDEKGLKVQGKLALNTSRGRDIYELMRMKPRPAINGLSIGYRTKEFALGTKPNEPRRTLKKVDLLEVSLVTFASNQRAAVTSVKAGETVTRTDVEQILREAGLPARMVKSLVTSGWKSAWDDPSPDNSEAIEGIRSASAAFDHLTKKLKGRS